jgi:threonine/homoserine/homoserine lactone efflux protein
LPDDGNPVLTELIPLALVIALSPVSIIPAVLVLQSPRPRAAGLAFMVGWLIGLTLLTVVFLQLSGLAGGRRDDPPAWASWLRIVVGSALIVFGAYRWFTRSTSSQSPKWMASLSKLTPPRAAVTSLALTVVNPKVLLICVAAGLAIGSAGHHAGDHDVWLAVVYFVAVAGSTVALPILAYAVSGHRLDEPLNRLGHWMERQHAALIAGILVVVGLLVLYKGIHGL